MRKGARHLAIGAAVLGGTWTALRLRMLVWGSSGEEASRRLPGDDLVPNAQYETTHAITIHAPAENVFPWIVQMGQNRGGFYSHDALENLLGLDIHSADRIHPEWQELVPGVDYVSLDPHHAVKMTIAVLHHPARWSSSRARPARRLVSRATF